MEPKYNERQFREVAEAILEACDDLIRQSEDFRARVNQYLISWDASGYLMLNTLDLMQSELKLGLYKEEDWQ